jgi:tungstate transport system permease protein
MLTLIWDGRRTLLTASLAGFGRAIGEVGAIMIVGGNIDHATRVLTTAIALETGKGDFALALGLGFVLIALALAVNFTMHALSKTEREGRW